VCVCWLTRSLTRSRCVDGLACACIRSAAAAALGEWLGEYAHKYNQMTLVFISICSAADIAIARRRFSRSRVSLTRIF